MSTSYTALVATAQRELDALRTELDARLIALERALVNPDPGTSLERLVIDLARVATAEAESAAARATLEAQLRAREEAVIAVTDSQAALEAERAGGVSMRAEIGAARERAERLVADLERTTRELEHERTVSAGFRRQLDLAQGEIQTAIDTDAAQRRRIAELELAIEHERARHARSESEANDARVAARASADEAQAVRASLEQALGDARRANESRAQDDDSHRAALAAVERRCAELDAACQASQAREDAAAVEHQRVVGALDRATADLQTTSAQLNDLTARLDVVTAREDMHATQAVAQATQVAALNAQLEAERQRADQAGVDRDEVTLMLDAARTSIQDMQAAVDDKLAAIDAKRAGALRAAEERAETAQRERDAMAIELASAKAALGAAEDADTRGRLAAAAARIRLLELQLFERERGPKDLDVDLGSLLPAAPAPAVERGAVPATRHGFKPPRRVRIDREGGLLIDLSVSGAQVICATPPEVGRIVTLALLSDEAPCFCQGRLLWSRREQTAKGRPYRYPAGIVFTAVDDAALRAFIRQHAAAK